MRMEGAERKGKDKPVDELKYLNRDRLEGPSAKTVTCIANAQRRELSDMSEIEL